MTDMTAFSYYNKVAYGLYDTIEKLQEENKRLLNEIEHNKAFALLYPSYSGGVNINNQFYEQQIAKNNNEIAIRQSEREHIFSRNEIYIKENTNNK